MRTHFLADAHAMILPVRQAARPLYFFSFEGLPESPPGGAGAGAATGAGAGGGSDFLGLVGSETLPLPGCAGSSTTGSGFFFGEPEPGLGCSVEVSRSFFGELAIGSAARSVSGVGGS